MSKDNLIKIGGELKSVAADSVVAGAEAIYDYNEGKSQAIINQDLKNAIEDIDVTDQMSGKADKSEMSVLAGTGANSDKTTITLKSGTSATVLTQHQDISGKANVADVYTQNQTDTLLSGKQNTISNVTVAVDANTGTPAGTAIFSNNTLTFDFQNLKGEKGDTGAQGIQGVQGERGPKGDTGVTGDASSLAIIHGVDTTTSYANTDVAGADAVQDILKMLGTVYYVATT